MATASSPALHPGLTAGLTQEEIRLLEADMARDWTADSQNQQHGGLLGESEFESAFDRSGSSVARTPPVGPTVPIAKSGSASFIVADFSSALVQTASPGNEVVPML